MNSIKTIIIAAALSALSGYAQAETVKPLQGISFHTETKDAVAYYLADKGTCKVVLMLTDKTVYAPTRFEEVVEAHKSTSTRSMTASRWSLLARRMRRR